MKKFVLLADSTMVGLRTLIPSIVVFHCLTIPSFGAASRAIPAVINFTHSINIVQGKAYQEPVALDAVKNFWAMALSPNVTNITLTRLNDAPSEIYGPVTADGLFIQTVEYRVQGTPTGTYNIKKCMALFDKLLVMFGQLLSADVRNMEAADVNGTTGPFVLRDVIEIYADTERTREGVLEQQIKPIWKLALGPDVLSFNLTVKSALRFFNFRLSSLTPSKDGDDSQEVTYDVTGVAQAPIQPTAVMKKFHDLVALAGLENVRAVPDKNGSMMLVSNISNVPTMGLTTTAPLDRLNGEVNISVIPLAPSISTAPAMTTKKPVVVRGAFHLPDSIAIAVDSRVQRNRVLNDQIKPIWKEVLGQNVSGAININVTRDTAFENPFVNPEGKIIRRIDYAVDGISTRDLNFNEYADRFHILALNARFPNLWAVPDPYGSWVLASSIPKKTK